MNKIESICVFGDSTAWEAWDMEKDVWVISFNTTKTGWDGYKEIFYSIADSFSLKK